MKFALKISILFYFKFKNRDFRKKKSKLRETHIKYNLSSSFFNVPQEPVLNKFFF